MKTYDFNGTKVQIKKETYRDGTLAVVMEKEDGENFGVATVNLRHPMQSDSMAFLDENNLPGIGRWMKKNGLGVPMGYSARSGFCEYPLYTFFIS